MAKEVLLILTCPNVDFFPASWPELLFHLGVILAALLRRLLVSELSGGRRVSDDVATLANEEPISSWTPLFCFLFYTDASRLSPWFIATLMVSWI